MESQLTKFWEIEEPSDRKFLSLEETECEEHFKWHTCRDSETGRYTVSLPFKIDRPYLGDSYTIALRQFNSLERSFVKNTALQKQ